MTYNLTAVQQGLNLARQRYQNEYNAILNDAIFNDIRGGITATIDVYEVGETYLDRFITLYSEFVGLAQIVRTHNDEPRLQREELISALSFLAYMINSFKHD
jgi:hypothetical protein